MEGSQEVKRLAKLLAYVLSERPDEFGLLPDAEGWVRERDLFSALAQEPGWTGVRSRDLQAAAFAGLKIELAEERVRAVSRRYAPPRTLSSPPKLLYLCVREKGYAAAVSDGVLPAVFPYVMLSPSEETARRWGKRRGAEILLTVNAAMLQKAGASLLLFGEEMILADRVPAGTFSGPSLAKIIERKDRKPAKAPPPPPAPPQWGSFYPDPRDTAPAQKGKGRKKRSWKDGGR